MTDPTTTPGTAAPSRWVLILVLYLSGLFMGALDTGIITPARTIIQSDLGVDEKTGIWMITVYTLAYAAAIPVMGKLADQMGRKPLYLIAIGLFGVGSLLCGVSQDVGSFELLIIARIIQAIGGGGIVPIATAEVGTSVPEEKRGMALGLVGGVYGIANVFGASAGSLILDIVGIENWQWIFYINVPIAIAIILVGLKFLPAAESETRGRLDLAGITVLVALILALLYGLQHLDFFNLGESLRDPNVWPFLLAALLLLPLLVFIEMRAADPVLNLRYFSNRVIGVTLLLAALSGVIMMSIVFIPQFAENSLAMRAGSGGYLVVILGLASGVGAPMSGRLTDKYGPRAVLGTGALITLLAAAVLVWWTAPNPSMVSVVLALILMGLGLGFLIGSPINYLLLKTTSPTRKPRTRQGRWPTSSATWKARAPWTASSAATSGTARPRWPCAPRSRPFSTAGRSPFWFRPRFSRSSTSTCSRSGWPHIPYAWSCFAGFARNTSRRRPSARSARAPWTSSSARTACFRRMSASRTWVSLSLTRSSASA